MKIKSTRSTQNRRKVPWKKQNAVPKAAYLEVPSALPLAFTRLSPAYNKGSR